MLCLRRNRDDLRGGGGRTILDLGQRGDVELAIGTPVAADEGGDDRPLVEKLLERNQPPVLVRKQEWRERLADLGSAVPSLRAGGCRPAPG